MTIEEKARAYDEALDRCKAWASGTWGHSVDDSPKDIVEFIFPQLAESKDEKTRKELVEYHKQQFEKNRDQEVGLFHKDALAYLEKQKEPHYTKRNALFDKCVENCDPKTVEEVNKRVDDIMNMPELSAFEQALTNFIGYWEDDEERWPSKFVKKHGKHILDIAKEELQKEQKPVQSDVEREYVRTLKSLISDFLRGKEEVDREYYQQIFDWLDGRHIEQKPILEVFGFKVGDAVRLKDGDGRKHIIKSFEEVEGLHGPNFYHVEFEDDSARSGIYTGEEYPNGYYTQMEKFEEEQKPAEWSEDIIRKAVKEVGLTQHQIDWFKTNVFQPKMEWSEEDEERIQSILLSVCYCKDEYPNKKDYLKDIAWLKALPLSLKKRNEDIAKLCSNEWSEEDEKMLDKVCCLISPGTKLTNDNADYCIELKQWIISLQERILNSTRPQSHWKPTKEQMKWLKDVLETVPMTCRQQVPLESLYNDLLKLADDCINTYHRTFIQEL